MKKAVIPFLSVLALIVSAVCRAQEASAQPKRGFQGASSNQPQIEQVICVGQRTLWRLENGAAGLARLEQTRHRGFLQLQEAR